MEWIGIRPERRGKVVPVTRAQFLVGAGIEGDHAADRDSRGGRRHVTLLQREHLAVIAALLGIERVEPASLRRNVIVGGVNLLALKDRRFRVGEALLEGTGPCHPCSRMEETLGPGGYQATRGHGGITARVLGGGFGEVGDVVETV